VLDPPDVHLEADYAYLAEEKTGLIGPEEKTGLIGPEEKTGLIGPEEKTDGS
jgi:hypothetical protein